MHDPAGQDGAKAPVVYPKRISYWRLMSDQGVITQEILDHKYAGSGTESDPFVVTWLPDDPRDPMRFGLARKVFITCLTGFATLAVSLASSAYSGSLNSITAHFQVGDEVATLGLSLYVIGFSVGPLLWAPLSENIGRQIPFFISFFCMSAFLAGCAGAQNIQTLVILRFFAGVFGSSPLSNSGGVVSDMFSARQRGLALCLFAATPYAGPALGPSIGGFLSMNAGWRWVEGLLSALAGLVWILLIFFLPETYAPVLLRKRALKLSEQTGKCYMSVRDIGKPQQEWVSRLKTIFSRPWILLIREPIVFLFTFYAALIYGTLYMLFDAFPVVYEQERGWNEGVAGLPFIGVLIGTCSGVLYTLWDHKRYDQTLKNHNGFPPPEARLPPSMVSAVTVPIGLFWFAWTNSPSIHWLSSVAAMIPFGFGLVLIYLGIVNYLVDSYTLYSASVLAAMSILRYSFGGIFPLFTRYMYAGLGIHWASSIPAFLSLACMPMPFVFYYYGAAIRSRCKYGAICAREMEQIRQTAQEKSEK
ncbi:hypothetical protein N7468_002249 [Penicillium chermesinum]|uniref:Major facilitator superfamily (MFS) profile domain-containing protein n=1 Tax=Penicillium chermesinum TaxID=63820 RepID=A0A9W9TXC8_9EURO|nr:uncharacterized protein N7468_002249 [Penicillium chermesinum]KAJ5247266.1 hypothetical protein N7468_002249 [Penicillium chermesinum]